MIDSMPGLTKLSRRLRGEEVQARNAAMQKALDTDVTANPILELDMVRQRQKKDKKREGELKDLLTPQAEASKLKINKGSPYIKIGAWIFEVRYRQPEATIDEEKLAALCAAKGWKAPLKKIVTYIFDEEAFHEQIEPKLTEKEYARIVTQPEPIKTTHAYRAKGE